MVKEEDMEQFWVGPKWIMLLKEKVSHWGEQGILRELGFLFGPLWTLHLESWKDVERRTVSEAMKVSNKCRRVTKKTSFIQLFIQRINHSTSIYRAPTICQLSWCTDDSNEGGDGGIYRWHELQRKRRFYGKRVSNSLETGGKVVPPHHRHHHWRLQEG